MTIDIATDNPSKSSGALEQPPLSSLGFNPPPMGVFTSPGMEDTYPAIQNESAFFSINTSAHPPVSGSSYSPQNSTTNVTNFTDTNIHRHELLGHEVSHTNSEGVDDTYATTTTENLQNQKKNSANSENQKNQKKKNPKI